MYEKRLCSIRMPTPFVSTEPFCELLFGFFKYNRRTLCGQRDAGNYSRVQPQLLCLIFSFLSITRSKCYKHCLFFRDEDEGWNEGISPLPNKLFLLRRARSSSLLSATMLNDRADERLETPATPSRRVLIT